jgi:hypothetical protein
MSFLLSVLELVLTLFGFWVASWIAGRWVDSIWSVLFGDLIPRRSLLQQLGDRLPSRPEPRGFDVVMLDERNIGKVIMKAQPLGSASADAETNK